MWLLLVNGQVTKGRKGHYSNGEVTWQTYPIGAFIKFAEKNH
jgi:hypothetical protein